MRISVELLVLSRFNRILLIQSLRPSNYVSRIVAGRLSARNELEGNMRSANSYWVGKKPPGGKRWAYTAHGEVLEDAATRDALFRMYRRYVKQWNDIELDRGRSLSEHTHQVFGAQAVGANRRFVLHARPDSDSHWILEMMFARGFSEFYPGASCGRNTMRSPADIRSIHLHWSEGARGAFDRWITDERTTNSKNGEWEEYRK